MAVCVVTFLGGCSSGSCSRQGATDSTHGATNPSEEDPAVILSKPVVFDAQSLADVERSVTSGRPLSDAEIAQAVVTTEAAVNNLGQTLELLWRNEDDADTWNVINEMAQMQWPAQATNIIAALYEHPIDATVIERLDLMVRQMEFNNKVYNNLHNRVKTLPEIFDISKLH